jgi:signal transduction histidine kinase
VTFDQALHVPPAGILGVRDQLVQVLVNLLLNAVEAMPTGGTVRIGSSLTEEGVELRVSDTGSGFGPEVRSRIFEPFFTTKRQGVGLGLAISKSLIEAHGGDLHVRSSPGEGTCFTISLPGREEQSLAARKGGHSDDRSDSDRR